MLPLLFSLEVSHAAVRILAALCALGVGAAVVATAQALGAQRRPALVQAALWMAASLALALFAPLPDGPVQLAVRTYWICDIAAFVALAWVSSRVAEGAGLSGRTFLVAAPLMMACAVLTSRLFFLTRDLASGRLVFSGATLLDLALRDRGVNTFAVLGGAVLSFALLLRLQRKPLAPYFDALFTAAPLGFGLAKLGCFLTGCCYGHLSEGLGVTFPRETRVWFAHFNDHLIASTAQRSLPVLPVQLAEALVMAALFGVAWLTRSRFERPGQQTGLVLTLYASVQLAFDRVRADPERGGPLAAGSWLGDITLHAWLGLAVLVLGVVLLQWSKRRPPLSEAM